jgi:O-antigen/teichoic acid export membrane protein
MIKKLLTYGFIRHSLALITPDLLQIILRALTALVTARLLGPENLGLVAAVGLIMSYGVLFQGGITDGMRLKVSSLIGQKKHQKAELCLNNGFAGVITIMSTLTLIILVLSYLIVGDELVFFGIIVNSIGLLFFQIYGYLEGKARLFYHFRAVFYSQTLLAVSQFVLTVTGTYFFGIYGFFTAMLFFYIPSIIYLRYKKSEVIRYSWDYRAIVELMKLGFPVLLGGMVFTFFTSIDKWFILTNYGVGFLGYYSVIIGLATMLSMVPTKFASLLGQYLLEASGADCPTETLWSYTVSLLLIGLLLLIPLVMVASDFSHLMIVTYLTKFELSLPLIDILFLSFYVATISSFCATFLISAGYTVLVLKIQTIGVIMSVLFNVLAVSLDSGLIGIAMATFFANLFLGIVSLYCVCLTGIEIKNIRLYSILAVCVLGVSLVLLPENSATVGQYSIAEAIILFVQRASWDFLLLLFLAGFVYYSKMYKSLEGFVDRDFSV